MSGDQDPEFWRILCQIRIIKYCAEPSVRELPEYEGCLRFGNKFKRSLNPSRVSCQYQAVNAYHQDSFIRTLHCRTKFPCRRQRYCQTRYTRRRYDLIPRDKSRSLTLGYTQVSDLLSHGVISKSYSYGNEPLSVPTKTKVNCITTYQEYEVYTPAFNLILAPHNIAAPASL